MAYELFDEELSKQVVSGFQSEIADAERERAKLSASWDKWRKHRELVPDEESKDFPWKDASNVVTPLAAIDSLGLFSSLKAASSQKKPFYTVDSNDEKMRKHAEALTKYLAILVESKFHLDLRRVNNEVYYELSSLGTQFVQIPWLEEKKMFKRRNEDGELEQATMTKRKGPAVIPIQIENFYARGHVTDLQRAPWIAIKHTFSLHELKDREAQNIFENVEDIEGFYKSQLPDANAKIMDRTGIVPTQTQLYEVYEVYQYIDVDDDGLMEDVRYWIEPDSGVILREELNELGLRPIVRIPFIHRSQSLYAIGVGWLTEGLQDACDALFNMAINSTHISSLQMFVTREGSNLGKKEDFYPFKQITAEDPKNDFMPITFPNTIQPNMMLIGIIKEWADRLTGASNAMMGMPDTYAKTRATASGTMFLAQQGSRLFNAITENVEDGYDEIGMFIVFQLIQNQADVDLTLAPEEDRVYLEEIFSMSLEDIHLKFNFRISNTELEETAEAKRQSLLTLSQLYSMYGQQALGLITGQMQLIATINPQALKPIIEKYVMFSDQFLVGSTNIMKDILEYFKVDRSGLLPYVKDIAMMNEMMASMKDMQLGRMMNGQGQVGQGGGTPGTELTPS